MKYIKGNLLNAESEALVNTVNTVGIMGKGIALQFKERFPENYKAYKKACKEGEIKIGKMFVFKENTLEGEKIIINFPTKTEWYYKSSYKYIEEGLKDLVRVMKDWNIKSIAIPPLGCGNGGLNWEKVKSLLEKYLSSHDDLTIVIYEPNEKVKQLLQKESSNKKVKLTSARAMLLYALFEYEKYGESATVFTANKLAYFLQQSGENLKLKFTPYAYGPYAHTIEKVLYKLNSKYLKGLEQMEIKPFEELELNYDHYEEVKNYIESSLSKEQKERLKKLFITIDGFESTLSLEILASVHYIMKTKPMLEKEEVVKEINSWSNRKKSLIDEDYVEIAFKQLSKEGRQLNLI